MKLCDKNLCTGCGACMEMCSLDCIKMIEDEFGFFYPQIDSEKCVECGLCSRTCPVNKKSSGELAKNVYACWSMDVQERKSCTSGGMATVFSRKIILDGGVVYGCALTDKGISHIRVDKVEKLELLKGSKYVQSNAFDVFKSLKEDIKNGISVLFIGTPCQCEAIRAIAGETSKLYLIDLICTGVPPQKFLWEHLGYDESCPEKIRFRDETGSRLTVWENDRIVYQKPADADYFFMGFSTHLTLRESCYSCKFASDKRCADLTLGDFWGLGKKVPFTEKRDGGVSLVVVNSDKGKELVDSVKDGIFMQERTIMEAKEGNPRYYCPSSPNKKYQNFMDLYKKIGYKKAIKACMRKERLNKFLYRTARKIKKIFK